MYELAELIRVEVTPSDKGELAGCTLLTVQGAAELRRVQRPDSTFFTLLNELVSELLSLFTGIAMCRCRMHNGRTHA